MATRSFYVASLLLVCFSSAYQVYGAKDGNAEIALRDALFGNRKPYNVHTRPSVHSNQSSVVELGLSLIYIQDLDAKTETLISNVWLRMLWYDYSLHWNEEDYNGVNVLRVSQDILWKPDMALANSEIATSSAIGGDSLLLIYPTGQVLWVPPQTYHSTCKIQLKNFPFDEQSCDFVFRSWSHDGHSLLLNYYDSKNTIDYSDYWEHSEWEVINRVSNFRDKRSFRKVPELSFTVHLRRRSCYYIFTLGLPIILSWVLILTLFWLPPTAGEKLTLGSFVMLYHVLLLVYLQWLIPHNGSQVPRIVSFCSHSLIFSGISIILCTITVTMSRSADAFTAPEFLRRLLTGCLGTVLCLGSSRKGISLGAKLLTSSNIELSINSESREEMISGTKQPFSDWELLARALDRIFFIFYCIVFVSLILSFLCAH